MKATLTILTRGEPLEDCLLVHIEITKVEEISFLKQVASISKDSLRSYLWPGPVTSLC